MRLENPISERELEAVAEMSRALARARDPVAVARVLVDRVLRAVPVTFAGLWELDGDVAVGVFGVRSGEELDWWTSLRLPVGGGSGMATAARDRAAVVVPDCLASSVVNAEVAERVGARSAAFVPMFADEAVVGVLAVATDELHDFSPGEVAVLEAFAAEAGLALERSRTEAALAEALDRERLVARIAHKVRSELDLDAVLDVATRELGSALVLSRCFIRMGEPDADMRIAAEWDADGVASVGGLAGRLPVSNRAARERRTASADDVDALDDPDPAWDALRTLGTRSVLATPIVVFDRMIGTLGLHRTEPWRWSPAEVALAEAVAREIGLAIHNAEILAENRERLKQQESLLKAAQAVTSELRLETVLGRLVAELTRLLGSDAADCYFLDAERGMLRCAAVHGLDRSVVGWEFSADKGLAGQALRDGAAVLSEEYEELRFEVPHPAYDGFARAIVAPMGWAGEVRGIVGVGTRDASRRYRRRDVEAVEVFASLAGLAVRNAESFEHSARQARVQRGFYRIASVLSEPLSLDETLPAIAQAAAEALGGDAAAVLFAAGGTLRLRGEHGLPAGVRAVLTAPDSAALDALADSAAARRLLASPDAAEDDRLGADWQAVARREFASLLSLPLEQREGSGLVLVFFRERRAFTDDDLEVGRHLSSAARGALERSALYEEERTANALSRQLARTGSRLAVELDPDAVIAEVVNDAAALLAAGAAALWEASGEDLVLRAGAGGEVAARIGRRAPATVRPVGDVVQGTAPVAVSAVSPDERAAAAVDPLLEEWFAAAVGVPLVGPEGSLYGVLAVYDARPRDWRPAEVQALEALAGNTAAALANAELYQRVAFEKRRSDAILGSVADGIVAVDRDGRVVLWNAAAEQISGIPASEAVGRLPEDVLQRGLSGDPETALGERLVTVSRGGEDVWLSVTEAVMRDPAGGVAGRVFAFRDVSAERQVEQLKSDFVASVSHELRAPLTSIFGFAETLLGREGLFGERERRTFLRYIAAEAERLTNIVEQLLNVARLEAGDLEVETEVVDVRAVVDDAVAQAGRLDEGGLHRFTVDVDGDARHAEADRDKLRQVLTNLLDNSVKFSPDGGTIAVSVRRRLDRLAVEVADEGVGIPQSEHELIFRKFYRAPEALGGMRGDPGAGLGLFIARGLVRAMHGRMWVASVEGEGSRFVFELPLAPGADEERDAP